LQVPILSCPFNVKPPGPSKLLLPLSDTLSSSPQSEQFAGPSVSGWGPGPLNHLLVPPPPTLCPLSLTFRQAVNQFRGDPFRFPPTVPMPSSYLRFLLGQLSSTPYLLRGTLFMRNSPLRTFSFPLQNIAPPNSCGSRISPRQAPSSSYNFRSSSFLVVGGYFLGWSGFFFFSFLLVCFFLAGGGDFHPAMRALYPSRSPLFWPDVFPLALTVSFS